MREPVARDSNLALMFSLKLMFFDFEKKNNAGRLIFQSVSKILMSRDERFKTKMTLGSVKGYN